MKPFTGISKYAIIKQKTEKLRIKNLSSRITNLLLAAILYGIVAIAGDVMRLLP